MFYGGFSHPLCWSWSDVRVGWQVRTLPSNSHIVFSVAFLPDGERVVSGSADNLVKIWDDEIGAEVSSFAGMRSGWMGSFFCGGGGRAWSCLELN